MTKSLFSEPKPVKKGMPTLEEIQAFCVQQGLEANDGTYMYYHWDDNGFTLNGKPVKKWRSVVVKWKAAGHLPSQDPRRQRLPSRFTADRRHDERRGEPGRRSDTGLGVCLKCKRAWEPDGKGGVKDFCKAHEGTCKSCCGCE